MDVDDWWAGLTEAEQQLALRHRDDDPLHPEVVRQLNAAGVMWGDPCGNELEVRWHWTSEVQDLLAGGCE